MERREGTQTPQVSSEKPRSLDTRNHTDIQISERQGEAERTAVNATAPKKLLDKGGFYLYAGPGRKPRLLEQLEGYVKRELQSIDTKGPHSQETKLQVYRNAFSRFIEEFRNYQPLLGAIQKEYENTLVHLQEQIKELKPLRSRMRLVTEECDRKLLARWDDGRAQVRALEEEKRRLLKDMGDAREREERLKVVVTRLQRDLASQYLQYREERDSRSLLLLKHSLCRCFVEEGGAAPDGHAYDEDRDPVKLKVALKVCREDLAKAQLELAGLRSEYWGVVPRRDWDALEDTHKRTLLQLQTLQGDFAQLKSEHDALLEVHKRDGVQAMGKEADRAEDGEFLNQVKKPSLDERQLYINQLREKLDGEGLVSVADARIVLKSLDPPLESAVVEHALGLAFQVSVEDLDQNPLQLDTEVLLQRLAVSPMTGPLPEQH